MAQELDICENDSENTRSYNAGVQGWGTADPKALIPSDLLGCGRKGFSTPDLSAGFHVWGCEFTPQVVNFYFDGKLTHSTQSYRFKNGLQNIWLTAIGYDASKHSPPTDDSKLPAYSTFDYVRYFEKPGTKWKIKAPALPLWDAASPVQ